MNNPKVLHVSNPIVIIISLSTMIIPWLIGMFMIFDYFSAILRSFSS